VVALEDVDDKLAGGRQQRPPSPVAAHGSAESAAPLLPSKPEDTEIMLTSTPRPIQPTIDTMPASDIPEVPDLPRHPQDAQRDLHRRAEHLHAVAVQRDTELTAAIERAQTAILDPGIAPKLIADELQNITTAAIYAARAGILYLEAALTLIDPQGRSKDPRYYGTLAQLKERLASTVMAHAMPLRPWI
jgi:hypothetical protein